VNKQANPQFCHIKTNKRPQLFPAIYYYAHVVQYLHQHLPLKDFPKMNQTHPLTYIQDLIMREAHKHQRNPTHQMILMGDLNSSWTTTDRGGAHPALKHWAN
jgi:hypothetical protein